MRQVARPIRIDVRSISVARPITSAFRAENKDSNSLSSIMSKELVNKLGAKNTKQDLEIFEKLISKNIQSNMTYEEFKNKYEK